MKLRTRLEQRNIRSARERVRHFLALNASADGRTVAGRRAPQGQARGRGGTHQALYRTVAALERAGEIKRMRGKITLTRPRSPCRL
jgi:hypothetical protein